MFWNILKRDLKNKKTMNIILLIFIVISSMLIAGSVNGIISITEGISYFQKKAGIPELTVLAINSADDISEYLENMDEVKSSKVEDMLMLNTSAIITADKKEVSATIGIMSIDNAKLNYFSEENEIISSVKEGEILLPTFFKKNNIKVGDKIKLKHEKSETEFIVAGFYKDFLFNSPLMGNKKVLLNNSDYKNISDVKENIFSNNPVICVDTDNPQEVIEKIFAVDSPVKSNAFMGLTEKEYITIYAMDILTMGIIAVASICIILIALVVMNFIIKFTISERYKEIGVLKAIGIKDFKIRMIYLVKYFAMAVIGAGLGAVLSFPLGDALIKTASANIVLENSTHSLINIICAVILVFVVLMIAFISTANIKKFSPLVAIHSGESGERYHKKSAIKLSQSKLRPTSFMALNDVMSNFKRFGIIICSFALVTLLLLITVNSANTMQSEKFITLCGFVKSDMYYVPDTDEDAGNIKSENGYEKIEKLLSRAEKKLSDNGINAKVFCNAFSTASIEFNGKSTSTTVSQPVNIDDTEYSYSEGVAPEKPYEIAITNYISDVVGAKIGDRIKLNGYDHEFLVTGLYDVVMNMGNMITVSSATELDYRAFGGIPYFQIRYNDNPDAKEIAGRKDRIIEILNTEFVYAPDEIANQFLSLGNMFDTLINTMFIIACGIIILITALTEYSFIEKEKNEIALLKVSGFKIKSIIGYHIKRFVITTVVSIVLGVGLSIPLGTVILSAIFSVMGMNFNATCVINPLQIFVICPVVLMAVTILSAFVSSLKIVKISESELTNVE